MAISAHDGTDIPTRKESVDGINVLAAVVVGVALRPVETQVKILAEGGLRLSVHQFAAGLLAVIETTPPRARGEAESARSQAAVGNVPPGSSTRPRNWPLCPNK